MQSYVSPKYLESPDLYTKKGKPQKQENRRRYPLTPPPSSEIPQIILDILVGTLLGDVYGSIPARGVNPVFEFKQNIIHYFYLLYMYSIFSDLGYSNASYPVPYWTGDGNGGRHRYLHFRTIANGAFMSLFLSFYPTGVGKVLLANIFDLLTPRALAFWIMDDGGAHLSGLTLHTNNFTFEEVDTLIRLLLTKYGIVANR